MSGSDHEAVIARLQLSVDEPCKMSGSVVFCEVRQADLRFALSRIASLEGAMEPFAAVWDWDDSPRHFPQAVYSRKGVGLNLLNDDMRRAYEALHGRARLPNVKPDSEEG